MPEGLGAGGVRNGSALRRVSTGWLQEAARVCAEFGLVSARCSSDGVRLLFKDSFVIKFPQSPFLLFMIWDFGKKVPHYCSRNVIVPVFSSMLSTIARDSRWMPFFAQLIAAGLEALFQLRCPHRPGLHRRILPGQQDPRELFRLLRNHRSAGLCRWEKGILWIR